MEIVIVGIAVFAVAMPFVWPRWRRWEFARKNKKRSGGMSAGGLVAPFDEVFHPIAYTANLAWEAQQSIPAPAPNSDGLGRDFGGRITINLDDKHD